MIANEACGHCGSEVHETHGSINGTPLCIPDEGTNCYLAVTVYMHPMPCLNCPGKLGWWPGPMAVAS